MNWSCSIDDSSMAIDDFSGHLTTITESVLMILYSLRSSLSGRRSRSSPRRRSDRPGPIGRDDGERSPLGPWPRIIGRFCRRAGPRPVRSSLFFLFNQSPAGLFGFFNSFFELFRHWLMDWWIVSKYLGFYRKIGWLRFPKRLAQTKIKSFQNFVQINLYLVVSTSVLFGEVVYRQIRRETWVQWAYEVYSVVIFLGQYFSSEKVVNWIPKNN